MYETPVGSFVDQSECIRIRNKKNYGTTHIRIPLDVSGCERPFSKQLFNANYVIVISGTCASSDSIKTIIRESQMKYNYITIIN